MTNPEGVNRARVLRIPFRRILPFHLAAIAAAFIADCRYWITGANLGLGTMIAMAWAAVVLLYMAGAVMGLIDPNDKPQAKETP